MSAVSVRAEGPRWPHVEDVVDQIRALLDRAQHVVCLAHKDADADSLGSALAFAASLRAMGKTPHTVVPDPRPRLLTYLPGFDAIEHDPERVDLVFTFDCATTSRFGEKRDMLESNGHAPVVNIDHHVSNTGYGSVNLIEPEASATGQVVYRLLRALGAPIPQDAATNLYAALLTDTGGFRHDNTDEAALRLGADLVALGADPAWVAQKSYKSRSVSTLRLEAFALSHLHSEEDGLLLWSEVTLAMLREAGADMQESEGIIDVLQSVEPLAFAVLLKESGPDRTKVSVRTRGEHDATALCTPFGGGGHRRAAGADIRLPLEQAREQVLALARTLLRTA